MKISRSVLAAFVVLLGTLAAFQPSNVRAQTNTDIARSAFQVTVEVNVNNFVFTPVSIPSGKRLVVQSVSLSGAAQTTGAYVQPIVILASELGTAGFNYNYFGPNPSTVDPTQFYASYPTTIYADALQVGPAFAGYTPSFMAFNVVINGYLVDLPKTAASAATSQQEQGPDVKLLGNHSIVVH
ncbi:hypothetical protein [Dyella psychrodurans]|uniref:Uncharacterized protein n=1 Tax=Dyella psychrodurans TaxID=1927960 RepID=A0A370WV38_9GAMM|nr:hypothetical protein [Dyella psychrodurans]RDS80004.1 hypothetical protein DWU99_20315 [Dyella psychrodurans]